jgi:phosphoribosylanthranilate isomerase
MTDQAQPDVPLVLAGGLTPQNVNRAIQTLAPYAVDVSSGVESERGVKDIALIEEFCRAVNPSA